MMFSPCAVIVLFIVLMALVGSRSPEKKLHDPKLP